MTTQHMNNLSIPYELRIGVTGHRELPNPDAVERRVETVLAHLRGVFQRAAEFPLSEANSYEGVVNWCDRLLLKAARFVVRDLPVSALKVPTSKWTPLRWVVVSPLAKGADRIVARAVLNQPQDAGKPVLQVVTPFPLDDYRGDFVIAADREEFEDLLALDPTPTVLPNDYGLPQPGDTAEQHASKEKIRNAGYFAVGKRVVDSCEILIVIWNGEPAVGHGGTGDIVQYAVEQERARKCHPSM